MIVTLPLRTARTNCVLSASLVRLIPFVAVLRIAIGVALLVLLPVLYTDASDSWRLTSRRQRLVIGVASLPLGVPVELDIIFEIMP